MVLNYIWIAFFLIAFVIAVVRLIFFGDVEVFPNIMNSTFETAKQGFEISLGLTGVLSLWMGVMKIGEKGGVVNVLARFLSPLFTRLFPDIPLGLKAMEGMQELNAKKDTATNPMIMFLVLNTSGLTLIPVSIMTYRFQCRAAQPTDIFVPILIATFIATIAGIIITALYQHINLLNRTLLLTLGGAIALIAALIGVFMQMKPEQMNAISSTAANVLLFTVIITFIVAGMRKRINVYDAFIEGAKEGFSTAVRIIPYLIAILVAIGVFRASGAMDWLIGGIRWCVEMTGANADWVGALPTAIMKPLSGSGARGMMVDAMNTYGADSFIGRLSCIFQGSTDTTFYILAVFFGSIGVSRTRHAVVCGLLADLAGVVAAIGVCYLFFG